MPHLYKSESAFQKDIVDYAHPLGWTVAYFHKLRVGKAWITPVGADGKGWPDLVLCHNGWGKILFRELKMPPNDLTSEQVRWIRILTACGQDAKAWTPYDWNEIRATLSNP